MASVESVKFIVEHPVEGVHEPIMARSDVVGMSEYFQNSLIDGAVNVPVEASIRKKTLELILEYCIYHLEHPEIDSGICEWDTQFSSTWDVATTFRVLRACGFLNIVNLKEVALNRAKKILLETKVADLKGILNFPVDLSPEDRIP